MLLSVVPATAQGPRLSFARRNTFQSSKPSARISCIRVRTRFHRFQTHARSLLRIRSAMGTLKLRFVILRILSFSLLTALGAIYILGPPLAGHIEKLKNVHLHALSTLLLDSLNFNFSVPCKNL